MFNIDTPMQFGLSYKMFKNDYSGKSQFTTQALCSRNTSWHICSNNYTNVKMISSVLQCNINATVQPDYFVIENLDKNFEKIFSTRSPRPSSKNIFMLRRMT